MFAQTNCRTIRPLPLGIGFTPALPVDEIGWCWAALDGLYDQMERNSQLYRTKAYAGHMMRVLLLAENLPHAAAEISYRGTCAALAKVIETGKAIATSAEIEVHAFPSLPDLDGWRCDQLPEYLGIGQEASEFEHINRARNWLGGLYDDARTAPHDLRVEIVLLWHALPRAEIEQEYLGTSPTIEKMRSAAVALAKRLRTDLVDLDAEVAAKHEPAMA